MFNNDLMADVHFVVGPPGGTQRLPGHKVSNSCITGFALSSPQRDPLPDPGTGLGSSQAVLGFPPSQSRHNLSRGPWPRLLFFFFAFVSFYPALYPPQKHALFTPQSWEVVVIGLESHMLTLLLEIS